MNKKIISIICATVLTLCAVVGGMVFTGMQTNASGTQMTVSVESPTVGKDDEVKVLDSEQQRGNELYQSRFIL